MGMFTSLSEHPPELFEGTTNLNPVELELSALLSFAGFVEGVDRLIGLGQYP
jgi:hypothetical protein